MCGITLYGGSRCEDDSPWWSDLAEVNDARGPDAVKSITLNIDGRELRLRSSVLALRGTQVVQQPILSSDGQLILLWNGEIFNSTTPLDADCNDGEYVMSAIELLKRGNSGTTSTIEAAIEVLSNIEGPYAAVLYDTQTSTLLFGRDPLGRRSLLQTSITGEDLLICSSASAGLLEAEAIFTEVDCSSLWKVDMAGKRLEAFRIPRASTSYTQPFRLRELKPCSSSDSIVPNGAAEDVIRKFTSILSDSVRRRVRHIRPHGNRSKAQVAILFSGGLDCCTLAALANQHIDDGQPIDLLNVAFENPRVLGAKNGQTGVVTECSSRFDVPDRKTGRQSHEELKRVAPNRQWNFVEIDVPHQEYVAHRGRIESLIAPCTSVMDLSIGAALYFASKGHGNSGYTSEARVLLSGLGADELLGGYSRHRKAYEARTKQGLVEELQMDLDRLATRNLGRDDRILSSSGKEARYPYLAHPVISFLADLPVEQKMNFASLPPGRGDKLLLRQVAGNLGLEQAGTLVKRAIQFGARSAKMEVGDGKILGHEKLARSG